MRILKEQIAGGEVVVGMFALLSSAPVVEIIGHAGFDAVVIDTEHAPGSSYGADLAGLVRAADAAGVASLVRTTENRDGMILKALDAGAQGVLVPHVRTAEEARRAVEAARYPPLGTRSAAPVVRAARYGAADWDEYVRRANDVTLVLPMIEDEEAFQRLDEILEVPGIDGVFIGGWDLATDLGLARYGQMHDEVRSRCERIVAECHDRGLVVGCHGWDVASMQRWIELGCEIVVFSTDVSVFVNATRTFRAEIAAGAALAAR